MSLTCRTDRHTVGGVRDVSTRDRTCVDDRDDGYFDTFVDDVDDVDDVGSDDFDYMPAVRRRWHPMTVIAGGVLLAAVVATVGILNSDDSGTRSAQVVPPPRTAITTPTTPPAAAPAVPPESLSPETITTAPPGPVPSQQPHAAPGPTAPPGPAASTPAAPQAAPPAPPAVNPRTVAYTVTGVKQPFDLISVIYTDAQGLAHTDVNVALPWTKTVVLDPGVNAPSITATSLFTRLNCTIVNAAGQPVAASVDKSMIATCKP